MVDGELGTVAVGGVSRPTLELAGSGRLAATCAPAGVRRALRGRGGWTAGGEGNE
jgi:hypothetical protein